jgi:hypothetical protein
VFAIEMLAAGQGDALVVEYGPSSNARRLLIDGGPVLHWPEVRARLIKRRETHYESLVVTHIDEDHIGGVLALLDDPDLRSRVDVVWFNGYVHAHAGGSVLGPVHGELLTRRIAEGGYRWNDSFPDPPAPGTGGPIVVGTTHPLPVVEFAGGARAVILAPGPNKLKALAKEWEKVVIAAGLVPGEGADGPGAKVAQRPKVVAPLPAVLDRAALEQLAKASPKDSSKANGSSISFVVEFGGKRLLLTGDVHADTLLVGLRRYGELVGEPRPHFDLVKLPHHGSDANVTSTLVAAIDASRYLVSSNGDGYGHPDDAAIARLILGSPRPITLYANYASYRTLPWAERAAEAGLTVKLPRSAPGIRVTV